MRALSLAALLLTARAEAAVKQPDTLVYAQRDDFDGLDPAWAADVYSRNATLNIYEGLLGVKGRSLTEFEPLLSAEVPAVKNGLLSKDGRRYTFPIRRGVSFHDGTPLRPEDVPYSFLRTLLMNCGIASDLAKAVLGEGYPCDEKGALRPDAYRKAAAAFGVAGDSVTITLPAPFAPLLSILATQAPIVSRSWSAAHGEWDGTEADAPRLGRLKKADSYLETHANGTGAFALEHWDRAARRLALRRNDAYWRRPARLKRVVIVVQPETTTRVLLLKNGDVDVADASVVERPIFAGLPGVDLLEHLQPLVRNPVVLFNLRISTTGNRDVGSGALDGAGIPPDFFSDRDVRLGFAHSIDAGTFIRDTLRGAGRPASGVIPPGLIGHSDGGLVRPFDRALAEKSFRRARGGAVWSRGFHFTILVNSGSAWRGALANLIKRDVEALNPRFLIDVRAVPWSTFVGAYRRGAIPLMIGGEIGYPDPHAFAGALLHSRGEAQAVYGYRNAEVDRLIERALRETDRAARERLYARVQRLAFDDVAVVPVVEGDGDILRAQRSWVRGYRFNPMLPSAPQGSYYYDLWKEE